MGDDKKTTEQQTTQQATASPQEQRLLEQQERVFQAGIPGQEALASQIPETIGGILSGGQGLPDEFSSLFAGVTPDIAQGFAREAQQDALVKQQLGGILDSGVSARLTTDVGADIFRKAFEGNLQRRFNLLGLGLGQGVGQQQIGAGAGQALGGQLAGLRTSTGSGTNTTIGMNPFLRSFQTSAGGFLGDPLSSIIPGTAKATQGNTLTL